MPTVYVLVDRGTQDYRDAKRYGDIKILLDPPDVHRPARMFEAMKKLNDGLKDYGPDDWIILVGNPTLIAVAGAIAADANDGRLQVLQWERSDQVYIPFKLDVYDIKAEVERDGNRISGPLGD